MTEVRSEAELAVNAVSDSPDTSAGVAPRVEPSVAVRLVASHALAATAMGAPWPGLLALVWSHTGNEAWLGLAGAGRLAPYVALSWIAGSLGDRYGRVRTIRATLLLRTVLLAAAAASATVGEVALACVFATATVCAGTPAYPSAAALVADLAGDKPADAGPGGPSASWNMRWQRAREWRG